MVRPPGREETDLASLNYCFLSGMKMNPCVGTVSRVRAIES